MQNRDAAAHSTPCTRWWNPAGTLFFGAAHFRKVHWSPRAAILNSPRPGTVTFSILKQKQNTSPRHLSLLLTLLGLICSRGKGDSRCWQQAESPWELQPLRAHPQHMTTGKHQPRVTNQDELLSKNPRKAPGS